MGRWASESVSLRFERDETQRIIAAAEREGMTIHAWCKRTLLHASVDRSTELMQQAQRRYRTAGHPRICGCGECRAGGG